MSSTSTRRTPARKGCTCASTRCSTRPTKTLTRLERFFETFIALSQKGGVDRDGNIRDRLQAALTTSEFLLDPTYVTPMPRWLQKPALGAAAEIAKLRGYKAYHKPQLAPRSVG